jgi:hypothetical protein
MSGPNPKHGQALEADKDDEALVASGPAPKHGAAALSVGATAELEPALEPDSGSQGLEV